MKLHIKFHFISVTLSTFFKVYLFLFFSQELCVYIWLIDALRIWMPLQCPVIRDVWTIDDAVRRS